MHSFATGRDELQRSAAELQPFPFEWARHEMAFGVVLRRAKQKRTARTALDHAVSTLEDLGARLWSAKARRDRARIGGRTAMPGELTATEGASPSSSPPVTPTAKSPTSCSSAPRPWPRT